MRFDDSCFCDARLSGMYGVILYIEFSLYADFSVVADVGVVRASDGAAVAHLDCAWRLRYAWFVWLV